VKASGNSMHQVQGLPGAGLVGSTTQAWQPATLNRSLRKPRHVSISAPGQGLLASVLGGSAPSDRNPHRRRKEHWSRDFMGWEETVKRAL
jgi:hypothetical protein